MGSLAIPGVGPFIAAGPIMAALAGAGVGAAVGGLTGALIGMGIPECEAKRYEGKIKQGNILISVHSEDSDEVKRAKEIFERFGAHDISSTGEEGVCLRRISLLTHARKSITPPFAWSNPQDERRGHNRRHSSLFRDARYPRG